MSDNRYTITIHLPKDGESFLHSVLGSMLNTIE